MKSLSSWRILSIENNRRNKYLIVNVYIKTMNKFFISENMNVENLKFKIPPDILVEGLKLCLFKVLRVDACCSYV